MKKKASFENFFLNHYEHMPIICIVVPMSIVFKKPERGIVMPRGDGTGPGGMGPMTGRSRGYCAGYQTPGCENPTGGWAFWGCHGGGRGWRNWFCATGLPQWARAGYGFPHATGASDEPNEAEALRRQARSLERSLTEIRVRLEQIEPQQKG